MQQLKQAVMPGQGKVERRGRMVDVYLNDRAYWKDVPSEVARRVIRVNRVVRRE